MTLQQLDGLGDLAILWLTMWAEGRGDSHEGHSSVEERIAIGCVIRNRVLAPQRFDESYRKVCLAPRQFSCWGTLGGELNNKAVTALAEQIAAGTIPSDPLSVETQFLAQGIIDGKLIDRTNGSQFYVTAELANGDKAPAWVRSIPADRRLPIGTQIFMRNA